MEPKPKYIRTVGLIITIFAALAILANAGFMSMMSFLSQQEDFQSAMTQSSAMAFNPLPALFSHYVGFGSIMIAIAFGFLIGGIFLQRYKRWASVLLTVVSVAAIGILFGSAAILKKFIAAQFANFHMDNPAKQSFADQPYSMAAVYSVFLVLLIWFLNRKETSKHYE